MLNILIIIIEREKERERERLIVYCKLVKKACYFTLNIMLYRWTINTALKTAEKMFYAETPFDAEDLVEVSNIRRKQERIKKIL